jgi:hypothetical protein
MSDFTPCTLKSVPPQLVCDAADEACRINPINRPVLTGILGVLISGLKKLGTDGGFEAANALLADAHNDPTAELMPPQLIAAYTTKYWGAGGVDLPVQFLDPISTTAANKILAALNLIGARGANVRFRLSGQGTVRITTRGDGYWSYLGTDIRMIPANEPTMCLQGFDGRKPDSEFLRVPTHEGLHTCGCPHEHMRRDLILRLDRARTIEYFRRTQGWSTQDVIQQVLTPIKESTLINGSTPADETSIMCYRIPGECTIDGKPIVGGDRITEGDYAFISTIYPGQSAPPSPPPAPPPSSSRIISLSNGVSINVPPGTTISIDGRAAELDDDATDVLTE